MKSAIYFLFIAIASPAFAQSDCEILAKEWNRDPERTHIQSTDEVDLSTFSDKDLRALDPIQQDQIITMANEYAKISRTGKTYSDVVAAKETFRRDPFMEKLSFKGVKVDYVSHAPGDNLEGYIFESNTNNLIGTTSDDGMECL